MIAGPTAAGKTALAIDVAKHFGTVIVSADSRQFYRQLDIGTAKPTESQLREVKHYMVNNKDLSELYGAGHYAEEALALLEELFREHDLVVMAGGSGLYIEAVLNGMDDFADVPEDVRRALNAEYQEKGMEWLRREVRTRDERYYNSSDTSNPQRLIRALEVIVHTGKPFSDFLKNKRAERRFVPVKILINPSRPELYERINTRTGQMMAAGLLEEARLLYPQRHLNALRTVGYKELFDHMEGKGSLAEAVDKIRQHTRNYAKRQMTWFRNRDAFREFHPAQIAEVIQHITEQMRG